MRTAMVFGTFDGLHPGHIDFFKQARQHGDRIVAVVALDETVKKVKQKSPRQSEQERLTAVQQSGYVDEARLGYSDDRYRVIREVAPDVICLGYDQVHFVNELPNVFPNIDIVTLKPFHPEIYKSSKLMAE
jgi:FAD synthetase